MEAASKSLVSDKRNILILADFFLLAAGVLCYAKHRVIRALVLFS